MYRVALPFLFILAVGVLLIAYVPAMTTWSHEEGATSGVSFEDELLEESPGELPSGPNTPVTLPLGDLDLESLLSDDGDELNAADDDDSARKTPNGRSTQ